jgi:hypothetical protein
MEILVISELRVGSSRQPNAPDQKRAGTAAQKVATAPVFCIWMLGTATSQNGVIPSIASSSFVIIDVASAVKCFNFDVLITFGTGRFSVELR